MGLSKIGKGTLTASDLLNNDSSGNIAVKAGVPFVLGQTAVKRGQALAWGYGPFADQMGALGRFQLELKDNQGTPARVEGELKFQYLDQDLNYVGQYDNPRTENTTPATDVVNRYVAPEASNPLGEDKYLALVFVPDADATIVVANCTCAIDVTRYRHVK